MDAKHERMKKALAGYWSARNNRYSTAKERAAAQAEIEAADAALA